VRDTTNTNKYVAGRAKALLKQLDDEKSLPKAYPYPVQAWRLGGEVTLIALGGEVVVDFSLRFKKEHGNVWVMGYANDVMAYIPSQRVLKEGGYEGATAMVYYGLPTVWAEGVEDRIAVEVARQVKALGK
jgi:neutral ceramidase